MRALQEHDFEGAAQLFESVLRQYPEEKELHERVRQYLNICHRQAKPKEAAPQTQDSEGAVSYVAANPEHKIELLIEAQACRDDMSGEYFACSDGRTIEGCVMVFARSCSNASSRA